MGRGKAKLTVQMLGYTCDQQDLSDTGSLKKTIPGTGNGLLKAPKMNKILF